MLVIAYMVTSLEHHVLKEMGKTTFADFFSCASDMVSNVYVYKWITVVFMQNDC
jgi:hypothetical protein